MIAGKLPTSREGKESLARQLSVSSAMMNLMAAREENINRQMVQRLESVGRMSFSRRERDLVERWLSDIEAESPRRTMRDTDLSQVVHA